IRKNPVIFCVWNGCNSIRLSTNLLSGTLLRQSLLHPALRARLQVKGVTPHFLNDVFRLNLALKATEGVLQRFTLLQSNFCQTHHPQKSQAPSTPRSPSASPLPSPASAPPAKSKPQPSASSTTPSLQHPSPCPSPTSSDPGIKAPVVAFSYIVNPSLSPA